VLPSLFLGTEEIQFHGVMPLLTWGFSRVYVTLRLLKFLTPKRVRLKLCKALLVLRRQQTIAGGFQ
jgi:hypothetical protein